MLTWLLKSDFFDLPPVHLELQYLREFLKKYEMALIGYSEAWGKLIHEKNPELENLVAPKPIIWVFTICNFFHIYMHKSSGKRVPYWMI